jgi:DNA-binding HxlR family transcriptional regulator
VVGDPWSLLIVRDLMFKRRSAYSEFMRAGEGIATNILADRLAHLVAEGVAVRDPASGRYALTAKGVALMPILLEMMAWGAAFDPDTAASPAFVERIRTSRDALVADLTRALPTAANPESHP